MADVYYLYDGSGNLLYIGCSKKGGLVRAHQHRRLQSWGDEIRRVEFEVFGSYLDACLREESQIAKLTPPHNKASNPTKKIVRKVTWTDEQTAHVRALWLNGGSERTRLHRVAQYCGYEVGKGLLVGRFGTPSNPK